MDNNFKLDEFHRHEALDRVHVILSNIDEHVQSHPFIALNEKLKKLVDAAIDNLADLYSEISNTEK